MSQFKRGLPPDLKAMGGQVFCRERFGTIVGYSTDAARGRRTLLVLQVVPGFGAQVLRISENDHDLSRVRLATASPC